MTTEVLSLVHRSGRLSSTGRSEKVGGDGHQEPLRFAISGALASLTPSSYYSAQFSWNGVPFLVGLQRLEAG